MTAPGSSPQNGQPAILVIDDEDYVTDMIASVLQLEGFPTAVAYNGREGMEKALAFRGQLIIIDIMMPFLSGTDIVERIRQNPALDSVHILLISAGARPRDSWRNVAFLPKPFDIEQLLSLVFRTLNHAR